jgi:DNA helicase-2/ATP-dependent DNA helicase PcrA
MGHVLPSLGLDNVGIVRFRSWLVEQRERHFPTLPGSDRIDTPAVVQMLKLHPLIGRALELQIERVVGSATPEQALDDWASVLTTESLLREVRDREAPDVFDDDDLRRFVDWNRRSVEQLQAQLAGDREAQAELDGEDDALLLRAWQLRVGPLRDKGRKPLQYRHVLLDEVQDFSPLEVQLVIGCMHANASITLAGDTQQQLAQHGGFTSWQEFLSNLGIEGKRLKTLRINYRSSVEITRFAHSLLGTLNEEPNEPEAMRVGPPVEVFRFDDRGACVFFLGEALRSLAESEPLASVAILTPSPELSAVYFEGLERSDLPRLRWVQEQDFSFAAGIELTEIEQVKGLEFDYVILVEVDARQFPDNPSTRRRLHVGASRAIHQLWLTTVGTPSPLLDDLHSSLERD